MVSKLRGEEREFLDRPLAFGEGLTDDTYMEWILERAKRLFLILAEVGVPDRVLGAIDDSWQDDDLPIALKDIHTLDLAIDHDEALEKRFYDLQFLYLLRQLGPGCHIDYGPKEHIPMEYVHKLPPAVSLQSWDRVHFPGQPDTILTRRRIVIGSHGSDNHKRVCFLRDIQKTTNYKHHHIAPVWASYTSDDAGYILSDFVPEHTLRTFIDHRTPPQYLRVTPESRPILLIEWMHCLADTIASLHHRCTYHGAIRPSNILIDHDNQIAFADLGHLRSFQSGRKINKSEIRDYSAPESQLELSSRVRVLVGTCGDVDHSDHWPSRRNSSIAAPHTSPSSPRTGQTPSEPRGPTLHSAASMRNFSRHIYSDSRAASVATVTSTELSPPASPTVLNTIPMHFDYGKPQSVRYTKLRNLPCATPQAADVFSLGCIFLDILTFMLKGKLNEFIKFRSVRSRNFDPDSSNGTKPTTDTSFHADSGKIDAWLSILRAEAFKHDETIFRSVPELLKLVKRMLGQNAELRPSAKEVRDCIEEIVHRESKVESLCCAGREWEILDENNISPSLRDSMSIATSNTWRSTDTGAGSSSEGMDPMSPNETASETRSVISSRTAKTIRLPWRINPFAKNKKL